MANLSNINNKFLVTTGGNVGINTTSPTQKVEIAGGYLKFSGGDYGIQGSASLTYNPVSDHYFQASGSTKVTIKASGKVGIGTTSPTEKLRVQGDSGSDLLVRFQPFTNNATSKLYLSSVSSGDGGYFYNSNNNESGLFSYGDYTFYVGTSNISGSIGSPRMTIKQGGNVGIGTTNPTAKLKVIGVNDAWTCQIENTQALPYGLSVNTTGTAGTTFNSAFYTHSGTGMYIVNNGKVGIGVASPTANLHVQDASTATLKVITTGVADASVNIQGYDAGVHIGDATNGLRWAIWNDGPSTSSSLKFGSYALGTWYSNSSQVVTMTSDGKVGIGTTSPSYKLDVNGTLRMTSSYHQNVNFTNTPTFQIGTDSYSSGFFVYDSTAAQYRMVVKSSTGNVGIGTVSPTAKLEIVGSNGTNIFRGNFGGSADIFMGFDNANPYLTLQDNSNVTTHLFQSNVNNYIVGSNLGIGTTSPSYKLHVSGTGGTRMSVTNTDTNWAAIQVQASGNQADYIFFKDDTEERARIVALDTNDLVFSNTDSATERMRIASSGNVGIGTDSPTYKLHIDSDDANDDVVFIHHDNAAQSSGTLLKIKTDAGDSNGYTLLDVQTNTGNALFVRGDRNVGVGTTSLGTITGNVSAITIGGTNGSVSGGVMYQFNGNNAASHYYESSNFRYQNIGNYDHTFYTSNTTQRFQINTNGWSYFNNQGTGGGIEINGTSGKYLDIYCNASLAVFSTNASDFYFNTDVGIGATNPTTKLTVQGVITAGDSTTNGVIRRQHQTFSTMKPGPSSGGSVDMMFVDHTNALDITVMAYINTSNVATGKGYLVTAYGSAVGGLSNTRFAGVISALSISYVNTGGSENYVLRVTCTYSGSTAPTISVTASGQSTSELRAAI